MELVLKHVSGGNFELGVTAYLPVSRACVAAVSDLYISTMLTYAVSLRKPVLGEKIFSFIEEVLAIKAVKSTVRPALS
ncbi:MAG: hypothetical protein AAF400_01020 [Bacteroidota bacterium]